MGLPIWRDPEESTSTRDAIKTDPTAAARSSIRRRPSVHGRRGSRPPLPRESSRRPNDPSFPAFAFSTPREWRRSEQRLVPTVGTLLESSDPRSSSSGTRARHEIQPSNERGRQLAENVAQLHFRAGQLDDGAGPLESTHMGMTGSFPRDWDEMTEAERQRWLDQSIDQWIDGDAATRLGRFSQVRRDQHRRAARHTIIRGPDSRPRAGDIRRSADHQDDDDSLFVPGPGDLMRQSHPLRRSWRAESPIDGLGDRIRSPTPADGWEIMRTTIAPDENLPSAESSFTSAAARESFNPRGSDSTEPGRQSASESSNLSTDVGEDATFSVSSVDPDDLLCNDEENDAEERAATAAFAQDMFFFENASEAGIERIARHRTALAAGSNLYALPGELEFVEIGFRLINEALDSTEGRERVFHLSQTRPGPGPEYENFEEWIFAHRRDSGSRTRLVHVTDEQPPSPHPERYSSETHDAVRAARGQVHDYFRRITADALTGTDAAQSSSAQNSPPPRYERLASRAHDNNELLSGNDMDLDGVRRIVERLAQREDIPDEWWTSVGLARHLNQSRSRV